MVVENKELVEEITKTMTDAVEKALPEIVQNSVKKEVAEIQKENKDELEEVKNELKKINLNSKKNDKEASEAFKKSVVVKIFQDVMRNNITTEQGFNDTVAKVYAGMSEGEATEGAELVFDQFENDVLRVINEYAIVNDVRILPLAKGDKVKLPKATNGITTYFVDEAVKRTASKPSTAFITINIAKTATLTDMTEELLDDTMTIPDLYNLIVEFVGESQAEFLEQQILIGTGDVKGVLVDQNVNVVALGSGKTSDNIDDDTIVDVITRASRKYKRRTNNVKFYMSQYIFGKLRALKTLDGYPLYPSLRDATPTLFGYKVELSDVGFVQNLAQDKAKGVCLLFGDMKYYILARRKGLTVERGYYGDNWASDIQSIKSTTRVGGDISYPEALTILVNGTGS